MNFENIQAWQRHQGHQSTDNSFKDVLRRVLSGTFDSSRFSLTPNQLSHVGWAQ
jgi:hypothetical protein